MKLLVLPLLLLTAAAAAAEAAADPYTTDINNRKLKLTVEQWRLMCPDPHERESRRLQHRLLENPNGAKNAASSNGGAFAYDAAKAGESVDSNVDQAIDPGRSSNKQINDYPGSSGSGLDGHHTIDLQIWNKQHPPKPSN